MSPVELERALAAAGIACTVEACGSLAVILVPTATPFVDSGLRERAVALARQHGFSHLAVEIPGAESDAVVPGD